MDAYPRIPGYRIENKFNQGRLTEVYQAVKESTGQNVVIKVLLPELVQAEGVEFCRRFLDEANKAAKLDHPNIVKIIDVGEYQYNYYFVMEYMPENLRMRIVNMHLSSGFESGRVDKQYQDNSMPAADTREIVDMFKQVLDALDYAHQEDIIHGDIRPENIFFKTEATFTIPVVVDFCMQPLAMTSKFLQEKGFVIRDPHYTCPESILKIPPNNSCDFYHLGVIFFEMLTGHVPYDAEDKHSLEKLHVEAPIPRLPGHLSRFQPLLDNMMAKDAGERAGSAAELILMLEEFNENTPSDMPEEIPPEMEEISSVMATKPSQVEEEPYELADEIIELENSAGNVEENGEIEKEEEIYFPPHDNLKKVMEPGIGQEIEMTGEMESEKPTAAEDLEIGEEFRKEMKAQLDQDIDYRSPGEEEIEPRHPFDSRMKLPTLKTEEEGFISKLKAPRVLFPAVAAIIIIAVLLIIFLKPTSKTESGKTGDTEAGQKLSEDEDSTQLFEGESTEKYTRKLKQAQRSFEVGEYDKALQQIVEVEKIKFTPEVTTLKQQIQAKITEKQDDTVYQDALKEGNAASLADYLSKYPSGTHAEEARARVSELNELERKQNEERKKWVAAQVRLRSTPQSLDKMAVKAMVQKRGFFEKYYNSNGNFTNHYELAKINNQKVVIDYATGLMWHQSGSMRYMKYDQIQSWLQELNQQKYAGFSDWRLPTLEEIASLIESTENRESLFIDDIFSKNQRHTWTADKYSEIKVWVVDLFSGDFNAIATDYESFVRPVRTLN